MKFKHIVAGSFSLLLLAGYTGAQTKPPVPVKVTSVEGITEYRLANGLQVLLFPDQSKPTITVNITYHVGSRHEGYGESGMAHLLEHMVFKGSTKHKNIPAELTSHGASPNGTTWYDRTNYFETFNATDENLNWALDLESDRMINSFIDNKDLQSEFTVVRNEFESGENSPSSVLMERILSTAYLWHNYGKSTIGSKEDIEKVPIENLKAFYKKYYQPDNATLVVAGKIDEAKTLELVNKYFGNIPRPTRALAKTYTVEPQQDGERFVELRRVGDVQAVAMAYHISAGSHPDYAAIDVLNEVLTNEPNGRLYQSLVKSGKASAVWGYAAGLHDPGFIYINADVLKEKSLDDARKTMFASMDELKTKPITEAEVSKAKAKLMKDYETLYRNTAQVGTLLSEFIGQGDWRVGFLYRDYLKKITAADVNRVAGNYLINSNRTYGLFIPTNTPVRATIPERPNLQKVLDGYKGEAALASGEAFDPTPDNIDKRTETVKLTGGTKYNLMQKTTRGNSVEFRLVLRLGDEASMMNKGQVADFAASMLMRGTTKHTQAQINETLDRLKSTLRISGNGQTVNIMGQSTKENFPEYLDLVTEILHEASFPSSEFKTLVEENISGLEQERSEPQSIAGRELSRIGNSFPKGHILHANSIDEDLAAIKAATLDDVKAFYRDYYNGSSATGAVVGDFDVQMTKQKMSKLLDNWIAIKSFTRVADPYKEIKAEDKEIITPDKKNAMLLTGMEIKMRDDNADYPALMMGNFIFGQGFLNSRLATRIRQKEGISYGVGSYLQPGSTDEKTVFGAYAIYNPENKAKLIQAYKEELTKWVNQGITQEELDAAKTGIIQSRQTGRANDGGLAGKLSNNLYLNRTMIFDKSMDEKLEKLTVVDVNTAIKKYIDPSKMSYVKAGDFK
ncbi:MAG: insulinase family protein [Bacteroidetes bacterium]|nr:insulinase family protein [Bacteroidota bacterium]